MYDLYDYSDYYSSYSSPSSRSISSSSDTIGAALGAFFATFAVVIIVALAISIVVIIAKWIIFKKASRKPWESLIPVHSDIVVMELGGIETYWYFLCLTAVIPFIGWLGPIVLYFWENINLAKAFGKSVGYGILMSFFPFVCYPILAFGSAQYIGPQTAQNNYNYNNNVNYGPAQQYNQPQQQYNSPVQPVQPVQPIESTQPPVQPNDINNNMPPQQ